MSKNFQQLNDFEKLRMLSKLSTCYVDRIPESYNKEFKKFIVGQTLSINNNRVITYDIGKFFRHIESKNFNCKIKEDE